MSFTRKVKFSLTNHVDVTGIVHSNLFESEYSRVGLSSGNDNYTKALLHCNGTDASTTFTDSGSTVHTITAYGNAQIDTAQSKFGGASGLFDEAGDYLKAPSHADWDFGTGSVTLEAWIRLSSAAGSAERLISAGGGSVGNALWAWGFGTAWGGGVKFNISVWTGATWNEHLSNAVTLNTNTWYHVAFVRSGNTYYHFLDGVQVGTGAITATVDAGGTVGLYIACRDDNYGSPTEYFGGWMEEIRISKGIARWVANFTPAASEYQGYLTSSPSPATTWTALQAGDVVDMSTAKAWMYKDGVVQAAGNTDVTFKYAANGGSDSTAKTLTQLRAETDVTVTNETNSFKIYGLYASDGLYKSESETWIEFDVVSAAGGNVYCLID